MTELFRRKLIEVALPLEAINRESVREKGIRSAHPSTLHIWWSRKPLATARAILFSQLVDDPSAHPGRFPTEREQAVERRRLFDLVERLAVWENTQDRGLFREAFAEISSCFPEGLPPTVLDPFAGGGSIPLEAQRLGLDVVAADVNPVAAFINRALVTIPPHWANAGPVHDNGSIDGSWPGATGLASDVRHFAAWMGEEVRRRLAQQYPEAMLPDGTRIPVVAWIYCRTVTCSNPACRATMPLFSKLWLSKKAGRETWLRPMVRGRRVEFAVVQDKVGPDVEATVGRQGAVCLVCRAANPLKYVRAEGVAGRLGQQLVAVVAKGKRQKIFLPATPEQEAASQQPRPDDVPEEELSVHPQYMGTPRYGMTTFADLFTGRQLHALCAYADLVPVAASRAESAARARGHTDDDARRYARDLSTYLACCVSGLANLNSAVASWIPQNESSRTTFARQALPLMWDFVEVNPLIDKWTQISERVAGALEAVPSHGKPARTVMADAREDGERGVVVSTDPPYYDNIPYGDLSDFFYVWLRRCGVATDTNFFDTVLTSKATELIADTQRYGGPDAAKAAFESGFVSAFTALRQRLAPGVPMTVYYAFKQTESVGGEVVSTGWETMLTGLSDAGFAITATWPIRTEKVGRTRSIESNALASSIVLACRPREATADATTRRGFLQALKDELPTALREMQQGSVAPVDLAQAAIGPGMAVFTRYRTVVEADGSAMTVRTALALINQVLDEVLSEQEGDFDADTRFCVKWFSQFAWDEAESSTADTLSRATNTSVAGLERAGVFRARAGRARLVPPEDMSAGWNPLADDRVSVWEVVVRLARALDTGGAQEAARLMAGAGQRVDLDTAKELAYLLYSICEKRRWTQTALLFNGLGTSWSDLSAAARVGGALTPPPAQSALDFGEEGT